MQLELETKNEKDDPDKEGGKDKKFFDEHFQFANPAVQVPVTIKANQLLCPKHPLYQPDHHPSVPTPPPDASLI